MNQGAASQSVSSRHKQTLTDEEEIVDSILNIAGLYFGNMVEDQADELASEKS